MAQLNLTATRFDKCVNFAGSLLEDFERLKLELEEFAHGSRGLSPSPNAPFPGETGYLPDPALGRYSIMTTFLINTEGAILICRFLITPRSKN